MVCGLEALLEEAHIKLSSLVADLLGPSARRMLQAIADGAADPAQVAALAHQRMRATPDAMCDALGACRALPFFTMIWMALLVVLGYSRLLWCRFYPRQDMATLIDGLEDAFGYFGGVPQELLFDQMKAVITLYYLQKSERMQTSMTPRPHSRLPSSVAPRSTHGHAHHSLRR